MLERRARIEREFVHEHPARLLEGFERLSLAPASVQGEHQLSARPFPKGLLADQALEFGYDLRMSPQRELSFDDLLPTVQA